MILACGEHIETFHYTDGEKFFFTILTLLGCVVISKVVDRWLG